MNTDEVVLCGGRLKVSEVNGLAKSLIFECSTMMKRNVTFTRNPGVITMRNCVIHSRRVGITLVASKHSRASLQTASAYLSSVFISRH